MKKTFAVIFAVLVLMITFASCGGRMKHDSYKKVYDRYNDIKSFVAEADVTVKSNLTTNTYTVKQYYLAPDNYKMEIIAPESLSGTGYTYCNGKISMHSGSGEIFVLDNYIPEDRNYVFINDFFESYYKSEDAFVETSGGVSGECTVLKNMLSEDNPYRHSQCIWINNTDLLPEKLVTYDMEDNEVLSVEFKSFDFETELEKEFFK